MAGGKGVLLLALSVVDQVGHHVHTAALKFLAADHTTREKYLENCVFGFGEKRLQLDGLGECTGLHKWTRLDSVPNKEDVLEFIIIGARSLAIISYNSLGSKPHLLPPTRSDLEAPS